MATVNTPGPGGYLLAYVVTVLVFPFALFAPSVLADPSDIEPAAILAGWLVAVFYTAMFSPLFAAVAMPLVHFLCRRVRQQVVHVVVAGAVSFLVAGGALAVLMGTDGWLGGAAVGVSAMIGRAAVIPLVRAGRRGDVVRSEPSGAPTV